MEYDFRILVERTLYVCEGHNDKRILQVRFRPIVKVTMIGGPPVYQPEWSDWQDVPEVLTFVN